MPVRLPTVAGMFYPAQTAACRAEVDECLRSATPRELRRPIRGGVVPHAGWTYSGPTAARVFAAIAENDAPETLVLFGAVHRWGVERAALYGAGSWRTPLGDISIDSDLAAKVLALGDGLLVDQPRAHDEEHSIEVQLPFVRHLFPLSRILPIAIPPEAQAEQVGRTVAQAVTELGLRAVAIGSSDLTHYGPRYGLAPAGTGEPGWRWARANDARLLELAAKMQANEVLREAAARFNACGAGAIAAAISYASALGATEGTLLEYTTSYDVHPNGRPGDLVGYGALVFC
ncbi:MAG: AmmeMemoRadiSam system protein B [Chloroflexi bacterium]|nr:AmmeMemoRadiSam system protein B [Chloroflexota bacterium]